MSDLLPTAQLRVHSLACERGERTLFRGVNFELAAGQALQVTGANGCGKTSLLRLVAGLADPVDGSIVWSTLSDNRGTALSDNNFLYLGHSLAINPNLTVWENVRFMQALLGRDCDDNIPNALTALGLEAQRSLLAAQLSAGQKRRLALTRFYLSDATLWILDEPFTALDEQGVHRVRELISRQLRRGGMVLFTSHQQQRLTDFPINTLALGASQDA